MNFENILLFNIEGEQEVTIADAVVKEDKNGNPNYQFKLKDTKRDYTYSYNCGPSFIIGVLNNIKTQLGITEDCTADKVIEQAKTKSFKIWIVKGVTYFYNRTEYLNSNSQEEEAVEL